MKTLTESILANMDDTLNIKNPYKVVYPLPTSKDFVKNSYVKSYSVKWQCPELIKPYLNEIENVDNGVKLKGIQEVTGLSCYIDDFKCISVSLIDKNNYTVMQLDGIGDWVSDSITVAKKECINFFKTVLNDPDTSFRKIIDYVRKQRQNKSQYGFGDCITFEKLFK